MFEHSGSLPISMEIYEHIIKDLQEHSLKNEEVYHMQISTLKDKLKEKDQLIGEMSRRLGSITSQTQSEHDPAEFDEEEDCSLSAFTIEKRNGQFAGTSVQGGGATSRCFINAQSLSHCGEGGADSSRIGSCSHVQDIEEETRCLKQELNQLFKTKQLESMELNRAIDELKGQLVDYQTQKIGLCDMNHQLASENTRILTQLQQITGASNNLRDLTLHQQAELEMAGHVCRQQTAQIDELAGSLRAEAQKSEQLSKLTKEQAQTIERQAAHVEELVVSQSSLGAEVQSLRKEKEAKKEHSEKQHRLIVQYEKKNEENVREIRRLEADLANLHAELEQFKVHSGKLEDELKNLSENYEQDIKELTVGHQRKLKAASGRLYEVLRALTEDFREQLQALKQDVSGWPQWISDIALQAAAVMQSRSNLSVVTHSNLSLFNRQEMLEFEVEELRKELLAAKKENFELKYENKKLQDRRTAAHEKQKELRAQIQRLNQELRGQAQLEKLQTEQNQLPEGNQFRLSDIANRTAVQSKSTTSRGKKQSKNTSRKESANDQRIIQEITEMRKRIKNVREECLAKTMK